MPGVNGRGYVAGRFVEPFTANEFDGLTYEEVDERRRKAAAELERRQTLAAGRTLIGATVRCYFEAARHDLPDMDDGELGSHVIDLL